MQMTDLRSADVPGPRADDHVRGPDDAPLVFFYGDFACPKCAVAHLKLKQAPVRVAYPRCEHLGNDLDRFERDRRSDAVAERVKRDVHDALRGGATGTPTVWIAEDDRDLLDTMVTFGIRDARRIGPPTDGRARKGSTYEQ